jgi:hypothetical protein
LFHRAITIGAGYLSISFVGQRMYLRCPTKHLFVVWIWFQCRCVKSAYNKESSLI